MEYLILAYLGDAVYELIVRNHLINNVDDGISYLLNKGIKNVNDLQTESLNFVSAKSQRKLLEKLEQENILTETELDIVKKGRNAKMHRSKNNDIVTYHKATGFECLIGYLYQNDKNRLNEIMEKIL